MFGLVTNSEPAHTGLMTNTTAPLTSTEVAQRVSDNIEVALAERGRDIAWLANEIGISVDSILKAFAETVPLWMVLDASFYLNVAPDTLIGVPA